MDLVPNRLANRIGKPRKGFEFLFSCSFHCRHSPKFFEKARATCLTETGDVIEDRLGHSLPTKFTVERNRESVSLIANALQQIQSIASARNFDRLGTMRQIHLFKTLCE
jgi:hypothetical protein